MQANSNEENFCDQQKTMDGDIRRGVIQGNVWLEGEVGGADL